MNKDKKKICACPSCHSRYRVHEALKGKIVSCKKCGTKFKLSFKAAIGQKESPQKTAIPEKQTTEEDEKTEVATEAEKDKAHDTWFDLSLSEDKTEAYISPRGDVPDEISLDDIKELLARKGIKYGILDDALITEYLKNRPIQKEPWKIAEGQTPEPAKDSKIKYFFDTDTLKIGMLKEGGSIDFKDSGEISQVKKGDLIAEKIPCIDGTPGIDVFGEYIPSPRLKDMKLRCGKGAERAAKDELKVFANLDGRPQISAYGRLFVLPELKISEDVGPKTGHIDFDGNIEVHGSVRDGFRVRGLRLTVNEILKAEIDIDGDITVLGGIIGARIKTSGNIRAIYVRGSEIEALGDVVVENELFDSKIESSGACLIKGGKIRSSWISAKKGIEANEIGSARSSPCTLVVGFDERVKNEVNKIKEQITLKREEQENYKKLINKLREEPKEIEEKIGELAQVQDRATMEQRALKEKIEGLKKANNSDQLAESEILIKDLDSKISQAEKALEQLFNKQDQATKRVTAFQNKIKDFEEEIKELRDTIEALSEWSRWEKGLPVVKVHDTIFLKTTIRGPYSSIILRRNMQQVSISEAEIPGPQTKWKMNVSRLTKKI